MYRILFVCHGNICRSPMAEFIMKKLICQNNLKNIFSINSAAVTNDALGLPMDLRTKQELDKHAVPYDQHRAKKMTKQDYQKYDYLICMDEENFLRMNEITGGDPVHKEFKLLYFAKKQKDIDDPWYTGDFDKAFEQIKWGCSALLEYLKKENKA